jgi:hypothetical protein
MTLSIIADHGYAEFGVLFIIMLNVNMLSVVMHSDIMQSVIMLSHMAPILFLCH